MKILTINIGSRSKKYALFEDGEKKEEFEGECGIDLNDVVVGIRIVAPGKFFTEHREIDAEYLERLKQVAKITPLHIEPVIKEIEEIKNKYPDTKIIGVSDSAFHRSMPTVARVYAIPLKLREKYGIERQGYHGLSLASIVENVQKERGVVPEKMIVVHMGGGTSVTALKDGLSIDTSMGWTPLEGVPMAERVGDIDPGALAYLASQESLTSEALEKFISSECGLEAVSGLPHGDMKEIIEAASHNPKAKLALDLYIYRVRKYVGAMVAVLGGCDLLVLTGTIAEQSELMCQKISENSEFLVSKIITLTTREAGQISKIVSSF